MEFARLGRAAEKQKCCFAGLLRRQRRTPEDANKSGGGSLQRYAVE
jgi:hypothetical protein